MDEFLYLEPDEEITSVIDKLRGLESESIGLVAPKGSTIVQSLVSLKLIGKQAKELKKEVAIVTSDEVGQNLATQVGLTVYSDVKSHTPLDVKLPEYEPKDKMIEISEVGAQDDSAKPTHDSDKATKSDDSDIEIHRYDETAAEVGEASREENIVPTPVKKEVEGNETEEEKSQGDVESDVADHEEVEEVRDVVQERNFSRRRVGSIAQEQEERPVQSEPQAQQSTGAEADSPVKKTGRVSKWVKAILVSFAVILVIAALLFMDLLVSRMTINADIEATVFEKNIDITVEKDRGNSDVSKGIIGGRQIVKEKTFEDKFPTTGEKDAGEKAKGTLVFKNESGLDEAVSAGATVRSSGGVEFMVDSAVSVPKAQLNQAGDKILGQATAGITAKEAGSQANLPPDTNFTILGKSKVTAVGATSGGLTKKIKIVARADIDKAKQQYQDKKSTDFLEDADKQKGEAIIENSGLIDLTEFSVDKNVGDEADQITAKGKMKYTTMAFKTDDLKSAAAGVCEKSLTDGKGLILTDEDKFEPKIKEDKQNVGQMILDTKVTSHVGPKVDVSSLIKSWRLKPIKKVREDLEKIEGVSLRSLDTSPKFALPFGPLLSRNIKVNFGYSEK